MRQSTGATIDFGAPIAAAKEAGLFSSVCTIKEAPTSGLPATATTDDLGQLDLTDYTPVAGLENLPCMKAPIDTARPNPRDTRREPLQNVQIGVYHVLFDQYYAGIKQDQLASIDGVDYQILAVDADSQKTSSRIAARVVQL